MFIVFYTVKLCIFIYLRLVPHPVLFVTYLCLHVCGLVCMYVVSEEKCFFPIGNK